uniref:Putative secreted protein n=1 Tax=Anopheles darlingi TaxID=43151 RepID=A0A2M4DNV9_ANODA
MGATVGGKVFGLHLWMLLVVLLVVGREDTRFRRDIRRRIVRGRVELWSAGADGGAGGGGSCWRWRRIGL